MHACPISGALTLGWHLFLSPFAKCSSWALVMSCQFNQKISVSLSHSRCKEGEIASRGIVHIMVVSSFRVLGKKIGLVNVEWRYISWKFRSSQYEPREDSFPPEDYTLFKKRMSYELKSENVIDGLEISCKSCLWIMQCFFECLLVLGLIKDALLCG